MNATPDLAGRVAAVLAGLGSQSSPAELHGYLVGLLCAKGGFGAEEWLRQVVQPAEGETVGGELRSALVDLHSETVRQLNDSEMGFAPLLPDEDTALRERVDALGEWCQGFLFGLTEGGVKDPERLAEDAREVVRDIVNISSASSYDFKDGDEDEQAYAELVEYVRAGVLLLNEELQPVKAPPRNDVLH